MTSNERYVDTLCGRRGDVVPADVVANRLIVLHRDALTNELEHQFWSRRKSQIVSDENLVVGVAQAVYATYRDDLRGAPGNDAPRPDAQIVA
ncbi:MAG: hypothetical protein HOI95_25255 [Chromatiales bacterium]|nr:hypothetical protein [Chromatiales bacterium]